MERAFFLRGVCFNEIGEAITSVFVQEKETGDVHHFPMSFDLMEWSLTNHLCIATDHDAKILVYTKKYQDSKIFPTIKVFHTGDQKNWLFDEEYLEQHNLREMRIQN